MATKSQKLIPNYIIGDEVNPWGGLNTATKDPRFLKRGESYDSMNWITGRKQDNIQLRRGKQILGATNRNGNPVSGLGVGILKNKTQVPFFTYDRKIMIYDATADDTVEVNTTDIFPLAASGEDINIAPYSNLAGSFVYLTSPNCERIYKIPVANPKDVVDQQNQMGFNFERFFHGRAFACYKKGTTNTSSDPTGLYMSWTDRVVLSDYPLATNTPSIVLKGVTASLTTTAIATTNTAIIPATNGKVGTDFIESLTFPSNPTNGQTLTIILNGTSIQFQFVSSIGSTAGNVLIGATALATLANLLGLLNAPTVTNTTQVALSNGNANLIAYVAATSNLGTMFTGDGHTLTFTGILPVPTKNTIFYVSIKTGAGSETFFDDGNGKLLSNLGGTGTINYATGAFSVTFNTAPTNGDIGVASYNTEDATSEGVCDFSYNATTRVPFTGNYLPQSDAGANAEAVFPFNGVEYCFHLLKTWQLTLPADDVTPINLPYYEQIGIPNERSAFPKGDGVLFLDNSDPGNPTLSILQIPQASTNLTVVPLILSEELDFTTFNFDKCVVWHWGDYDFVSCTKYTNGKLDTYNSVTFIRSIYSGVWNKLDYFINCLAEYSGALIAGDSISPNLEVLFSGFDDDGETISNYWNSSYTDFDISGMKKVGYFNLQGLIQPDQKLKVSYSLDNGLYTDLFTIDGNANYVNKSSPVGIGSYTIGSNVIGGGGSATANEFEVDIPVHSDLFEFISFRLEALEVGYVQVNKFTYKDIRFKRRRLLQFEDSEINN